MTFTIVHLLVALVAGCALGVLACILIRSQKAKDAQKKIANAEDEALRIVNEARRKTPKRRLPMPKMKLFASSMRPSRAQRVRSARPCLRRRKRF